MARPPLDSTPPPLAGWSPATGRYLAHSQGHWTGHPAAVAVATVFTETGEPHTLPHTGLPVGPGDGELYVAAVLAASVGGDCVFTADLDEVDLAVAGAALDDHDPFEVAGWDVIHETEIIGCRSVGQGGRRCPGCQGEARRAKDRARYAARKARTAAANTATATTTATPVPAATPEAPTGPPATWIERQAEIVVAQTEIDTLVADARLAAWVSGNRLTRAEQAERDTWLETNGRGDGWREQAATHFAHKAGVDPADAAVRWRATVENELWAGSDAYVRTLEAHSTRVGGLLHTEILERVNSDIGSFPQPDTTVTEPLETELAEIHAARSIIANQLADLEPGEERDALHETYRDHGRQASRINTRLYETRNAVTAAQKDWAAAYADTARQVLADIRPIGGTLDTHSKTKKRPRQLLADAAASFPTEWIDASNARTDRPLWITETTLGAHYCDQVRTKRKLKGTKEQTPGIEFSASAGDRADRYRELFESGTKISVYCPTARRPVNRKIVSIIDNDDGSVRIVTAGGTRTVTDTEKAKTAAVEKRTELNQRGYQLIRDADNARQRYLREMADDSGTLKVLSVSVPGPDGEFTVTTQYRYGSQTTETQKLAPLPTVNLPSNYETVSQLTVDGDPATTIHELGHRMESTIPGLSDREQAFWNRRCRDENGSVLPGKRTGRNRETVYPDAGFTNDYSSKKYSDGTYYELLSTGLEAVFAGGHRNIHSPGGDTEHLAFTLGCLATG